MSLSQGVDQSLLRHFCQKLDPAEKFFMIDIDRSAAVTDDSSMTSLRLRLTEVMGFFIFVPPCSGINVLS